MFLDRLMPREKGFFDLFEELAEKVSQGSEALLDLVTEFRDVDAKASRLKAIEHEGDLIAHRCLAKLHATFITPFDREDIHHLTVRLDDILDDIEAVSQKLSIYEIHSIPQEAVQLAQTVQAGVAHVVTAVKLLRNMKNAPAIRAACVDINVAENEADALLRNAVAKLFRTGTDALSVVKWKELFETLESATDRCEDVADILEGIVIEHA